MPFTPIGALSSPSVITRCPSNPVLSAKDIPYDASLIFNAGVCKYQGRYVMVFRNDYGQRPNSVHPAATNIGIAYSDDGVKWDVQPKPCFDLKDAEISRGYDPRLTVLDGKVYMCFAIDTRHGVRGGIAVTEDFENFEILCTTVPDTNTVCVPKLIQLPQKLRHRSRKVQVTL